MKVLLSRKGLSLSVFAVLTLTIYHLSIKSLWWESVPTPWQVYITQRIKRGENISSLQVVQRNNHRKKVKHFILTKVEKTASSTLAAIFARFILQHKQNVMTMTFGGHLDITKEKGQVPGWNIGPRSKEAAEVLIDHARFNETFIESHFTPDVQLITSVRDAESWFLSAVNFWPKQVRRQSAERVLKTKLMYVPRSVLNDGYNGMKSIYHISQLQWLGFDYSNRNNMTAIEQYIEYIVPRFNVTILTDMLDASLVLLRRRFSWEHSDIIYTSKEVSHYRSYHLSKNSLSILLSPDVNLGDQMLYKAFQQSWWNQPELASLDFWDEVEYFTSLNKDQEKRCRGIKRSNTPYVYNATRWSERLVLDKQLCLWLGYSKEYLLERVARYALGSKFRRS